VARYLKPETMYHAEVSGEGEQEQTELTESFLKSSVSSVTSCEEVTNGARVARDE
jgi:hypothetical protein